MGCQLCVATVADDGTQTLRLQLPGFQAGQHGRYAIIVGVRFACGLEQVQAALESKKRVRQAPAAVWREGGSRHLTNPMCKL